MNVPRTPTEAPAFLIFDIETVADGRLVQQIRYPDLPDLSPEEAVAKQRQHLLETTGSDFIPHTFQVPVAVAIAKVSRDHRLIDVTTLDRPRFRPQVITRHFWQGWRHYERPTLVTFNGRAFDLPVLEMAAFRYGLSLGDWFADSGPGYQHPRNRYNPAQHLDLMDVLSNFGAVRLSGGLDLLATLLGKPGKMDTKGFMVQDLWQAGQHQRIDDYCVCDCLDTYFVFLRTRVLQGRLGLSEEGTLVAQAREVIASRSATFPVLEEYLARFRAWNDPGDDGWPFVGNQPSAADPATTYDLPTRPPEVP